MEKKTISKRLEILNQSNDGFYIAEGGSETERTGRPFWNPSERTPGFRIGDIYNDAGILKSASEAAAGILALDPDLSLPQDDALKKQLFCTKKVLKTLDFKRNKKPGLNKLLQKKRKRSILIGSSFYFTL